MTQDQQEQDLAEARKRLHPTPFTADRCRHESVEETTLWIYDGRRQIGSLTRDKDRWRATRMHNGQPTRQRTDVSLADAITYVTSTVSPVSRG
jgi:hypothetical protein